MIFLYDYIFQNFGAFIFSSARYFQDTDCEFLNTKEGAKAARASNAICRAIFNEKSCSNDVRVDKMTPACVQTSTYGPRPNNTVKKNRGRGTPTNGAMTLISQFGLIGNILKKSK